MDLRITEIVKIPEVLEIPENQLNPLSSWSTVRNYRKRNYKQYHCLNQAAYIKAEIIIKGIAVCIGCDKAHKK